MIADAAELLRISREALLDELLPACPPEHRYTLRMVANAMAIAAREVSVTADAQAPVAELPLCLPGLPATPGTNDIRQSLRALTREQVGSVELLRALDARVRQRLAISNPKKLNAASPAGVRAAADCHRTKKGRNVP